MSDLDETVNILREVAADRDAARNALSFLLRNTPGSDLRALGFRMSDTSSVDEFINLLSQKEAD